MVIKVTTAAQRPTFAPAQVYLSSLYSCSCLVYKSSLALAHAQELVLTYQRPSLRCTCIMHFKSFLCRVTCYEIMAQATDNCTYCCKSSHGMPQACLMLLHALGTFAASAIAAQSARLCNHKKCHVLQLVATTFPLGACHASFQSSCS